MKILEKLTSIRLAEVLTQKSVIATDAITDALYIQDQYGEPFVEILVSQDAISEWDLAKVVVEHFQLPFLSPSNYDISDEAKSAVPKQLLFEHMLVPLDVFDDALAVAMPIMTSFEVLAAVQNKAKREIFPFVGLISENRKVLSDLFSDFLEWQKQQAERREKKRKAPQPKVQGDWTNIFDTGDQAVKKTLKGT